MTPPVLYVIQHREFSGAEIMHAQLIAGDPIALVACPPASRTSEFAERLGARTVALPYRPLRVSGGWAQTIRSVGAGLRSARDLRKVLKQNRDRRVVFCTSLRPAMLAAIASVGLRRTLVWCVPDFLPPQPLRLAVRVLAGLTAAQAICLSAALRDDFRGRSRRLARISTVVHPGVDLERFHPLQAVPVQRAAIVGHISPTKQTGLAVEIAELVRRDHPEFSLRIVGQAQFRDEDVELERSLRARVESDALVAGAIEFWGHASDVAAALADCGALLHCRPDEPFGLVLIEAMALGLPVVAPRAGGPTEIVTDGVTGFLYAPGDVQAAANCLRRLIEEPDLARQMGTAARERVRERFTLARQLRQARDAIERASVGGQSRIAPERGRGSLEETR